MTSLWSWLKIRHWMQDNLFTSSFFFLGSMDLLIDTKTNSIELCFWTFKAKNVSKFSLQPRWGNWPYSVGKRVWFVCTTKSTVLDKNISCLHKWTKRGNCILLCTYWLKYICSLLHETTWEDNKTKQFKQFKSHNDVFRSQSLWHCSSLIEVVKFK